jgi:hypothetical protein
MPWSAATPYPRKLLRKPIKNLKYKLASPEWTFVRRSIDLKQAKKLNHERLIED